MSYEKQNWKTGDTITAEKLNHIEEGIEKGYFQLVEIIYDESTDKYRLNKTYSEINELLINGIPTFMKFSSTQSAELLPITTTVHAGDMYGVGALTINAFTYEPSAQVYIADSENGYPILIEQEAH